jgi:gamma-glutamyltranspeptidase/glutathione hydrolase
MAAAWSILALDTVGPSTPTILNKSSGDPGYDVRRSPLSYPFAAPHGITMWDGTLEGGADPQRDGYTAGV